MNFTFSGIARVVDADGLVVDGRKIRLAAVDSPEWNQYAEDKHGRWYNAGKYVKECLKKKVEGKRVVVIAGDENGNVYSHDRVLGTVFCGGEDIGEWLVGQGHSVAYTRYSNRYKSQELKAQQAKRGMWEGRAYEPEAWRQGRKKLIQPDCVQSVRSAPTLKHASKPTPKLDTKPVPRVTRDTDIPPTIDTWESSTPTFSKERSSGGIWKIILVWLVIGGLLWFVFGSTSNESEVTPTPSTPRLQTQVEAQPERTLPGEPSFEEDLREETMEPERDPRKRPSRRRTAEGWEYVLK